MKPIEMWFDIIRLYQRSTVTDQIESINLNLSALKKQYYDLQKKVYLSNNYLIFSLSLNAGL